MEQTKQLVVTNTQLTYIVEGVNAIYLRMMRKAQRTEEVRSRGTIMKMAKVQEALQYLQRRRVSPEEEEKSVSYREVERTVLADMARNLKATGVCPCCGQKIAVS